MEMQKAVISQNDIEILKTIIVYRNGPFVRVRRWLNGVHPERGYVSKGWTGMETVEEKDALMPLHTFLVKEKP